MKLRGKFVLLIALLFGGVVAVSVFFFYQAKQRELEDILALEKEEVNFFGLQIEQRLNTYIADIKVIENLPSIQGIVRARKAGDRVDPVGGFTFEVWKKQLEEIFVGYSLARPFYLQMRYLDENGMEMVRVSSTPEGPYVVPPEELQNKANRDYFQEAKKIPPGQTYISELNLNVEHEEIEIPHQPMLRFIRTIWNDKQEFRGMVVINVDANDFLQLIKSFYEKQGEDLVLVDQDGYFLANPAAPEKEFGKDLGTGEKSRHFLDHRELILAELSTVHTTIGHHEDELPNRILAHRIIDYNPDRPDLFFVLIESVPVADILGPIQNRFRNNVLIITGIFIISFLVVYFGFALSMVGRILENSEVARKIAEGDFTVRAKVSGNDEITQVGRSINVMAEQLARREEERRKQAEKLRMQLRELERVNRDLENAKRAMLNLLEDARKLEEELKEEKESVERKVEVRTRELREAKEKIGEGLLQLQQEKARLIASINSLSLGFIVADTNHNILVKNSVVARILGINDSEVSIPLISQKLGEEIDLASFCEGSISEGKAREKKDIAYNGKFLRIFVAPVIVPGEREKAIGYVLLMEDITEAKLLERAKDEFFSIASHELRTPLTAIRGNTSLMLEYFGREIKENKDLKEIISDTHESSVRLIKIVNDFLDASRLEQGKVEFKKEKFDLVSLTNEVIEQLQTIAKNKGLYMRLEKPWPNLPLALADKDKVRQVINNLVGNAINYTKKGGLTIGIKHRDGFLEVRVTDTGVGIPPQNQKLLFRKFQQAGERVLARDVTRGTGMGLYISKLLTEGMGGKVYLERSEVGKGTTFVFTLPAVESKNIREKIYPAVFAKSV